MATEYKLSYTASQIDERLGKINELESDIAQLVAQLSLTTFVSYDAQTLTEAQQAQARANIGAADAITVKQLEELIGMLETVSIQSANLFNYDARVVDSIPNSWVGATKDEFSTLSGWVTSNLIEVTPGKKYCITRTGKDGRRYFANSYITNFYASNGTFLSKVEGSLAEYVEAPANACYMYMFQSGNSSFLDDTSCIMVYSVGMDMSYVEYGTIEKVVLGRESSIAQFGLCKNGDNYYHFTPIDGEQYLVRHFKQMGVNNLFQLYGLKIGTVAEAALTINEVIGTTGTDNVGPISIHRGETDNHTGKWSGGVHGITVSGIEYPTARQVSLAVYCNGKEIIEDGIYYGNVTFRAVNDLYFPQTVTGSDLTSATKAIKETRVYTLTDRMNVKVSLDFYTECNVTQYYGCQCVTYGMDTVRFPNNEAIQSTNRNSNYVGTVQESILIAEKENAHYEVSVKPYGLGTFSKNTGTASDVGYCYLATFDKFYFVLVANELNKTRKGVEGTSWCWEAEYNYYIDSLRTRTSSDGTDLTL